LVVAGGGGGSGLGGGGAGGMQSLTGLDYLIPIQFTQSRWAVVALAVLLALQIIKAHQA
jgi:hypothetical protein